ncbi:hypothetical protein BB560_002510 [Smittium megazygosporum]|uniref:WDR59/RTC1-like RING zinc finger domain-containing protein n=1 Tax=Smittium megazygosporum TaxID=133381 RepID=A0A2T9ZEL8_9FUNG|nr:hypothetical protein BB560_002510 [Smittium megazygosporum]
MDSPEYLLGSQLDRRNTRNKRAIRKSILFKQSKCTSVPINPIPNQPILDADGNLLDNENIRLRNGVKNNGHHSSSSHLSQIQSFLEENDDFNPLSHEIFVSRPSISSERGSEKANDKETSSYTDSCSIGKEVKLSNEIGELTQSQEGVYLKTTSKSLSGSNFQKNQSQSSQPEISANSLGSDKKAADKSPKSFEKKHFFFTDSQKAPEKSKNEDTAKGYSLAWFWSKSTSDQANSTIDSLKKHTTKTSKEEYNDTGPFFQIGQDTESGTSTKGPLQPKSFDRNIDDTQSRGTHSTLDHGLEREKESKSRKTFTEKLISSNKATTRLYGISTSTSDINLKSEINSRNYYFQTDVASPKSESNAIPQSLSKTTLRNRSSSKLATSGALGTDITSVSSPKDENYYLDPEKTGTLEALQLPQSAVFAEPKLSKKNKSNNDSNLPLRQPSQKIQSDQELPGSTPNLSLFPKFLSNSKQNPSYSFRSLKSIEKDLSKPSTSAIVDSSISDIKSQPQLQQQSQQQDQSIAQSLLSKKASNQTPDIDKKDIPGFRSSFEILANNEDLAAVSEFIDTTDFVPGRNSLSSEMSTSFQFSDDPARFFNQNKPNNRGSSSEYPSLNQTNINSHTPINNYEPGQSHESPKKVFESLELSKGHLEMRLNSRCIELFQSPNDKSKAVIAAQEGLIVASIGSKTIKRGPNLVGNLKKTLDLDFRDVIWLESNTIVSGASSGAVFLWDVDAHTKHGPRSTFNPSNRAINKLCAQPGMPYSFFVALQDGAVMGFDERAPVKESKNNIISLLKYGNNVANDISFDPTFSNNVAVAYGSGRVGLWDLRQTKSPYFNILAHTMSKTQCVSWSPNGKFVASGGSDGAICVWNVLNSESGDYKKSTNMKYSKPSPKLEMSPFTTFHTPSHIRKVAWRPDYPTQIASISLDTDCCISIWDMNKPNHSSLLYYGHTESVTSIFWNTYDELWSCGNDGCFIISSVESDFYDISKHIPSASVAPGLYDEMLVSLSSSKFPIVYMEEYPGNQKTPADLLQSFEESGNITKLDPKTVNNFYKNQTFNQEFYPQRTQSSVEEISLESDLGTNFDMMTFFAENYKTEDNNISNAFAINAQVALSAGRPDLSADWKWLNMLFKYHIIRDAKKNTFRKKASSTSGSPASPEFHTEYQDEHQKLHQDTQNNKNAQISNFSDFSSTNSFSDSDSASESYKTRSVGTKSTSFSEPRKNLVEDDTNPSHNMHSKRYQVSGDPFYENVSGIGKDRSTYISFLKNQRKKISQNTGDGISLDLLASFIVSNKHMYKAYMNFWRVKEMRERLKQIIKSNTPKRKKKPRNVFNSGVNQPLFLKSHNYRVKRRIFLQTSCTNLDGSKKNVSEVPMASALQNAFQKALKSTNAKNHLKIPKNVKKNNTIEKYHRSGKGFSYKSKARNDNSLKTKPFRRINNFAHDTKLDIGNISSKDWNESIISLFRRFFGNHAFPKYFELSNVYTRQTNSPNGHLNQKNHSSNLTYSRLDKSSGGQKYLTHNVSDPEWFSSPSEDDGISGNKTSFKDNIDKIVEINKDETSLTSRETTIFPLDHAFNLLNLKNIDTVILANERIVQSLITYYADIGELQMSATVGLLSSKYLDFSNDVHLARIITSYIKILSKLQLFWIGNRILKSSTLSLIKSRVSGNTFISSDCSNCGSISDKIEANLPIGCTECSQVYNLCTVCSKPVTGMYIWCQGCGHGGHYDHLAYWFEEQNQHSCPSGCGHYCSTSIKIK